jgi:hypothetical protein
MIGPVPWWQWQVHVAVPARHLVLYLCRRGLAAAAFGAVLTVRTTASSIQRQRRVLRTKPHQRALHGRYGPLKFLHALAEDTGFNSSHVLSAAKQMQTVHTMGVGGLGLMDSLYHIIRQLALSCTQITRACKPFMVSPAV